VNARNAKYVALFVLIQAINVPLILLGLPVCALCCHLHTWPRWAWLWGNDQDGPLAGGTTAWDVFQWTALRNPVHNLALVPGVFGKGRPLWYRTWTMFGRQFYAKAGWMSNGYIACSAGAGRGY
jgi:hypothetical protein